MRRPRRKSPSSAAEPQKRVSRLATDRHRCRMYDRRLPNRRAGVLVLAIMKPLILTSLGRAVPALDSIAARNDVEIKRVPLLPAPPRSKVNARR